MRRWRWLKGNRYELSRGIRGTQGRRRSRRGDSDIKLDEKERERRKEMMRITGRKRINERLIWMGELGVRSSKSLLQFFNSNPFSRVI